MRKRRFEPSSYEGGDYKMSFRADLPRLHIYAQFSWHDEVKIVGNTEGFEVLRALLELLKTSSIGESQTAYAHDGEGFKIIAVVENSVQDFDKLVPPYEWEVAKGAFDRDKQMLPEEMYMKKLRMIKKEDATNGNME